MNKDALCADIDAKIILHEKRKSTINLTLHFKLVIIIIFFTKSNLNPDKV